MKTLITIGLITASLASVCLASEEDREAYNARLSAQDHFSSRGERLTSAAAIIRQDRANFHKFGRRDPEDQSDEFFASGRNRDLLEKYLERGSADPAAIRAIVNGTPLIRIRIFTNERTGNDFIRVNVLEE